MTSAHSLFRRRWFSTGATPTYKVDGTVALAAAALRMNFTEYRALKIEQQKEENDRAILLAAKNRDPALLQRIQNYRLNKMTAAARERVSDEMILADLQRPDCWARAVFAKDPSRQTLDEALQIEWIGRRFPDVRKMPAGLHGTCLSSGELWEIRADHPRPADATKTFDIFIPSQKIYGTLKYTAEAGGAQDNQYRDVKHFIREAKQYLGQPGRAETFYFFLDGAYYTDRKRAELLDLIPEPLRGSIVITRCAQLTF
jgi:hypothetical protein